MTVCHLRLRWKVGRALSVLAFGICLVILGCVALGQTPQEVRAAILGADQRELLSCLGPPDYSSFDNERRIFLYRLDLRPRDPGPTQQDIWRPTFCNLLFEIDQGLVSDLEVWGHSLDGVNADAECTILVGRCIDGDH